MSTPPLPGSEYRLHPLSWLFHCIGLLRQFLLPIVGLTVFGNRLSEKLALFEFGLPLLLLVLVVGGAVLTQLSYRYTIGTGLLSVRSGLLERQWREIPFARIHNISVHQSLLHRLFGVAELKLESTGGKKPEADMKVLPLAQALALEQLIRQQGRDNAACSPLAAPAGATAFQPADPPPLVRLRASELLRLGLLSNRGMIVVLAALGALKQVIPDDSLKPLLRRQAARWVDEGQRQTLQQLDAVEWIGLGVMVVAVALLLTRLLSIALAIVQYAGFELRRQGARLTQTRGLFSRHRASVGHHRLQAWTLRQPLLYRWCGRLQIRVDIATGDSTGNDRRGGFRELVPLLPVAQVDGLMRELAPALAWPVRAWNAVDPRQVWRPALPWLLGLPLACAVGQSQFGPLAWAGMALYLPLGWRSWQAIRFAAWFLDERGVAIRGGAWQRWWRLAELAKVQDLRLHRSPLDRLCGTASLRLDTAGRTLGEPALVLPYLPLAQAQQLLEQLCARLSRPKAAQAAYQPAGPQ